MALSRSAEQALLAHAWPGNVRELQNRLQRARLVAAGTDITPEDLGLSAVASHAAADSTVSGSERQELEDVLRVNNFSVSRAAEAIGLSRQALYRRMERLGVTLERRPRI